MIRVNDIEVAIPQSLEEFTLGQMVEYEQSYAGELAEMFASIQEIKDRQDQEIELVAWQFEKMYRGFSFFANTTIEAASDTRHVDQIAAIYNAYMSPLLEPVKPDELILQFSWLGDEWLLPAPELKYGDAMQFGELIDAKQTTKQMADARRGKWEIIQHIAAIFLRRENEAYDKSFLFPASDRLKLMEELPMSIAVHVDAFFEQFNEFLFNHYPVFQPSRIKSAGKNSREHFDKWGWVNFLKAIAKTKVFDIPGSNSIECARMAPAFDVLVFASEDKELNEAQALDFEENNKK